VQHRQLGANDVPAQLWVDTVDDAAAVIGHTRDLQRFRTVVETTATTCPGLLPLLRRRPLDVLAAADDWAALIGVTDWVVAHPRPDIYLRQLDLPDVHTKLVEQHGRLLTAMLDELLPDDGAARRSGDFAHRFGFRTKPRLVRFRSLDPRWRLTAFDRDGDYTLTVADFARVPPPDQVFITENEVNFLAFPAAAGAIVVFGAGSGLEHLGEATWLASRPVHYWGDIDTHGYGILDQLRAVVPHASSLLMDRATLLAHEPFWGTDTAPTRRDLARLTPAEAALYDDLRDNCVRSNLRLEQERIRFRHVRDAVAGAMRVTP
jgi:hypothetical protein